MKIKSLNELATEIVGDGKSPNLFFVTLKGNTITVTTDFNLAYRQWRRLAMEHGKSGEACLEDRKWGEICGWALTDDNRVVRVDDSFQFARQHRITIEI